MSFNCCMNADLMLLYDTFAIHYIIAGPLRVKKNDTRSDDTRSENCDTLACWILQVAVADCSGVVQVFGVKKKDIQASVIFSILFSLCALIEVLINNWHLLMQWFMEHSC